MAIQQITNGMTGQQVADLLYANFMQVYSDIALGYVGKGTGFSDAITQELANVPILHTATYGITTQGGSSDTAGSSTSLMKFNFEANKSAVTGTVKTISVYCGVGGTISFAIGTTNGTNFTIRKTVGTYTAVAGLNTFTVNEAISANEYVVIGGGTSNGTASPKFASSGGLSTSKFAQMPLSGSPTFLSLGSYYSIYYTVDYYTGKLSDLYSTFPKFADALLVASYATTLDPVYLRSANFQTALQTEINSPATSIITQGGVLLDGGSGSGDTVTVSQFKFNEPASKITRPTAELYEITFYAGTAGSVSFCIGTTDGTKFTLRKVLSPFTAVVGVNTFTISEQVSQNEYLAFGGASGMTGKIRFGSGATGNVFKQMSSTGTDGTGGASSYYAFSFRLREIQEKPLDGFMRTSMPAQIDTYMNVERLGSAVTNGTGTGFTAELGAISTNEYLAVNAFATANGYISEINVNCGSSGVITFAIGLIDQNGYAVISRTFTKTAVIGLNTFTVKESIKANETLLVKTPTVSIRKTVLSGANYYRSSSAGYTSALALVTGEYLSFTWEFQALLLPILASKIELQAVAATIPQSGTIKPLLVYSPSGYVYKISVSDAGVLSSVPYSFSSMLVMGNSITEHPIVANTWWGVWGMAATTRDKDFVHVLAAKLTPKVPSFVFLAKNIYAWEINHATYDKSNFDSYFTTARDLVVLRMGENVPSDSISTLQTSYMSLIDYVRTKAPNATIIATGVFWANSAKDTAIKNACIAKNVPFVTLSQLDLPQNKQSIGGQVYGDDGQFHTITNSGVAGHPNDAGMQAIADTIYSALGI